MDKLFCPSDSDPDIYLNKIAKELVGESAKSIISCDVLPACAKGENFSSILHRIVVKYLDEKSTESISKFVVKIMPPGDRGKFMEKHNIFNHERHVYQKVLPEITALLSQIGCYTKLSPDCITVLSNPCAIVLEDLCNSNYVMGKRTDGLNLQQTLDILTKIAKFHAASIKIYEVNPKMVETLVERSISECINSFCIFYKLGTKSLYDEVKKWSGFNDVAEKLNKLQDNIIEKSLKNYVAKSSFNVLNHNDLWTNNFMFKYDAEGKLINSVIVDYQFVYWGSPGIDLNYLFFTSVEDTIRTTKWNFLIHYYHKILSKTLMDLEVTGPIPKVADIHAELLQKGLHAIIACLIKAAVVLAPANTVNVDLMLSETTEGSSYRQELFSNPKYIEFIKPLLWEFFWLGYLD